MRNKFFLLCAIVNLFSCGNSKKITSEIPTIHQTQIFQVAPDSVHARGIQVIDNEIFTANNNGFVYKYDISKKEFIQLSQLELPELRDIYVLSEDFFIALQSAEQAILLNSKGLVETRVNPFQYKTFLDGLDINSNGAGIVMGDPLEGKLYVALTKDFGLTWTQSFAPELNAIEGEAGFAASGTNVQVLNDSAFAFVSGGKKSRFFKTVDFGKTWLTTDLNFKYTEASGPFSMHFWDENNGIVVGGNYLEPNDTIQNCFLTKDGGKTWFKPLKTTSGYKSSVISCNGKLYACGSNGVDFSLDNGNTWQKLNSENAFALATFKDKVYATLTKGQVIEINTK
ncbi:MAG: WD40/YVTN/BNR-like repeat-containing protein [Flavobacteriia bacterium]|jgi:hypothetical protein